MSGPTVSVVRPWRTILLACTAFIVTLAGHSLGQGHLPDLPVLVIGALTAMFAAVGFAKSRRNLLSISTFVLGLQLCVHILASASEHHANTALLPSQHMMLYHTMASLLAGFLLVRGDGLITMVLVMWQQLLHQVNLIETPILLTRFNFALVYEPVSQITAFSIWHRGPPSAR